MTLTLPAEIAEPYVYVDNRVVAICTMEGDAYEMEDQRNWTDASYKTYIRPLALPWPYTIKKGARFAQKVTLAVRERNLAAQMFFRAHGSQATRLLRDYYEDSGEDAYQMELKAPAYDPFDGLGVIGRVNRIAQYEEN